MRIILEGTNLIKKRQALMDGDDITPSRK